MTMCDFCSVFKGIDTNKINSFTNCENHEAEPDMTTDSCLNFELNLPIHMNTNTANNIVRMLEEREDMPLAMGHVLSKALSAILNNSAFQVQLDLTNMTANIRNMLYSDLNIEDNHSLKEIVFKNSKRGPVYKVKPNAKVLPAFLQALKKTPELLYLTNGDKFFVVKSYSIKITGFIDFYVEEIGSV